MKYDLLCLPGVQPPGCGQTYVSRDLPDGHDRGDRITIKFGRCGQVREHEVRGVLSGLTP